MKFKELQTKPEAEVKKLLKDLRAEAHELSVKIRMNQVKSVHKLKALKKDIARVLTYLTQKKA